MSNTVTCHHMWSCTDIISDTSPHNHAPTSSVHPLHLADLLRIV